KSQSQKVYYLLFIKSRWFKATIFIGETLMKYMFSHFYLFLTSLFLLLSSCSSQPQTLTVMTHDSFSISEDVIKQFESENNVDVVFLQGGDAGSMLNKAILAKNAPLSDILFGVDN